MDKQYTKEELKKMWDLELKALGFDPNLIFDIHSDWETAKDVMDDKFDMFYSNMLAKRKFWRISFVPDYEYGPYMFTSDIAPMGTISKMIEKPFQISIEKEYDYNIAIDLVKILNYLEVIGDKVTKLNIQINNPPEYKRITDLPKLSKFTNLEDLRIAGEFSINADTFRGLSKLKKLTLITSKSEGRLAIDHPIKVGDETYNYIKELKIPDGLFDGLISLEKLYLSGVAIRRIRNLPIGIFKDLKNLKTLDLSGNYFTKLENGMFNGLTNIDYINLRRNFISEIQNNVFDTLNKLRVLDFMDNKLSVLSDEIIERFKNIEKVHLRGNVISETR